MAGFNMLIWNTKDSARVLTRPIEKDDEAHKRDLFAMQNRDALFMGRSQRKLPNRDQTHLQLGRHERRGHPILHGMRASAVQAFRDGKLSSTAGTNSLCLERVEGLPAMSTSPVAS